MKKPDPHTPQTPNTPCPLPTGMTWPRATRALHLLLEFSNRGARRPRRLTRAEWELAAHHHDRSPETVRTLWEQAKSDLKRLGAPIETEREGRCVVLWIKPGAWAFAHKTLDALSEFAPELRVAPSPAPGWEPSRSARRANRRAYRRSEAAQLRAQGHTLREIAGKLQVSVGTVRNDLKALALEQAEAWREGWEDAEPGWDSPASCLAAVREGIAQVARDAQDPEAKRRLGALSSLVERLTAELARRFGDRLDLIDDFDATAWADPSATDRESEERSA